jgi:hypothetical protein
MYRADQTRQSERNSRLISTEVMLPTPKQIKVTLFLFASRSAHDTFLESSFIRNGQGQKIGNTNNLKVCGNKVCKKPTISWFNPPHINACPKLEPRKILHYCDCLHCRPSLFIIFSQIWLFSELWCIKDLFY